MPIHVKVSGVWQEVSKVHQRISGTWEEMDKVHTRVAGTWQEVYTGTVIRSYEATTLSIRLFPDETDKTRSLLSAIGFGDGVYYGLRGTSGSPLVTSTNGTSWTDRGSMFNTGPNVYRACITDGNADTLNVCGCEAQGDDQYGSDKAFYDVSNYTATYHTPEYQSTASDQSGITGGAYGNSRMMISTWAGYLITSSNGGSSWTKYDVATTRFNNICFHSAGNRFYVAGGASYSTNAAYYATTGTAVTEITGLDQVESISGYEGAMCACADETYGVFFMTKAYDGGDWKYPLYRLDDPVTDDDPVLVQDNVFSFFGTSALADSVFSMLMTADGTIYFNYNSTSVLYQLPYPWTSNATVVSDDRAGCLPIMLFPDDPNYAIFGSPNGTTPKIVMPVPV